VFVLQPIEVDERAVFLRFELFAKRLNKLINMFTTVHQFGSLERHTHIAGRGSPFWVHATLLSSVCPPGHACAPSEPQQHMGLQMDLSIPMCAGGPLSQFAHALSPDALMPHTHVPDISSPPGLEGVLKAFWGIVDDVKRKPYDLLDFSRTQFDRDYLEFNVNIHDLEISLQAFINSSFENIASTQHALSLLAQFKAILLRDSLREELESKVQVSSWLG
jgi:hypothetical protein